MSPDGVAPGDGPAHDPAMEARVTRLEEDVGDLKAILHNLQPMIVRIDAVIPHLATKADLVGFRSELKEDAAALRVELKGEMSGLRAELKGEISALRAELKGEISALRVELKDDISELRVSLADKPSRAYMWGIMGAMVGAFACGLGGLAILK